MTIITLTGHFGSMGAIAARVASQLGYTLADRELILEAAQALGWTPEEVESFDERTAGHGSRLMRVLRAFVDSAPMAELEAGELGALLASTYRDTGNTPEMRPPDQRYIETLSSFVRSLAERGNAVIVGRGAQALLAGHPDALHVRVACDLEERVRRVALRDGMEPSAARARIADSDRQREAWHHKYFGIDYRSPYLYHLVMNSGWLSDEVIADTIARLAAAHPVPRERVR